MGYPGDIAGIQLFAELGRGATTVVYKGYEESLDRLVLVKILREEYRQERELVEQFQEEARLTARIQHPCVVTVYSYGEMDGRAYFVAEFVEGRDLQKMLAAAPLPVELATYVLLEAARGVQAAHQKNVLHRDVKPANILLAADGNVKVSDFGMALAGAGGRPVVSDIVGTVAYMAPEQVQGNAVSTQSDLFSLGTTFFEMLTGRSAFAGTDTGAVIDAILNDDPLSGLDLEVAAPSGLRVLCRRMMAKDPAERYSDCAGLIADVRALREEYGMTAAGNELASYMADPEAYKRMNPSVMESVVKNGGTIGATKEKGANEVYEDNGHDGLLSAVGGVRSWVYAVLGMVLGLAGVWTALSWEQSRMGGSDTPTGAVTVQADTHAARSNAARDSEAVSLDGAENVTRSPNIAVAGTSAPAEAGTNAGNSESSSSMDTSGPNADALEDRPSVDTGRPAGGTAVGDADVRDNRVDTLQVAGSSPDLRGEVTERANRTGRLTIECTPWAVVYVNGDSLGITPFTNPISLAAGRHQIEFRNPTFPVHQVSVEVAPGETRRMTVSLWDHVGELTVQVAPWGYVFLNGERRDTLQRQRKTYVLRPGQHILRVHHPEFGHRLDTLQVEPGGSYSVTVNLEQQLR